jgi:hypothetical protein
MTLIINYQDGKTCFGPALNKQLAYVKTLHVNLRFCLTLLPSERREYLAAAFSEYHDYLSRLTTRMVDLKSMTVDISVEERMMVNIPNELEVTLIKYAHGETFKAECPALLTLPKLARLGVNIHWRHGGPEVPWMMWTPSSQTLVEIGSLWSKPTLLYDKGHKT